jgi:hypothetical protein
MKTFIKSFLLLALLALDAKSAYSQETILKKVAPPEGSLGGDIMGMTQDKAGNMWMATKTGLYKYDVISLRSIQSQIAHSLLTFGNLSIVIISIVYGWVH